MKDWKILAQVKDATTPTEMRAELYRLRHFDPLVRAVFDTADYSGMSAEDRYTILAYHAMSERNKAMETALELANCTVRPVVLPSNAELWGAPPTGGASHTNAVLGTDANGGTDGTV